MAITRQPVDQEKILSADDMLEILSMLKPATLSMFEHDIVMSLYMTKAEQVEGDISKQTDPIVKNQIHLGEVMVELISRAREEVASLNDKVT